MGRENTSKGKSVRGGIVGTLGIVGIVGRENRTREQRWEWKGVAADTCWIIGSCFSAQDGWVLCVLPWTRVGTVNIPWIDTGTKVVREVEHGGRFINISSTAQRVAQGISARCSMEAQCWGSILGELQVKHFLEDSVWLNISLTMKIPIWSLVKMNDLNLLKALLAKNRFLV